MQEVAGQDYCTECDGADSAGEGMRQPPITPRRMASMLTGPIGAAAANPIKNAAESTWT